MAYCKAALAMELLHFSAKPSIYKHLADKPSVSTYQQYQFYKYISMDNAKQVDKCTSVSSLIIMTNTILEY